MESIRRKRMSMRYLCCQNGERRHSTGNDALYIISASDLYCLFISLACPITTPSGRRFVWKVWPSRLIYLVSFFISLSQSESQLEFSLKGIEIRQCSRRKKADEKEGKKGRDRDWTSQYLFGPPKTSLPTTLCSYNGCIFNLNPFW